MHLRKEIIIVDYGMGNLYSIKNALKKLCNHKIKYNCFISNGINILSLGNCCVNRFIPKKKRSCKDCGCNHRNRKVNKCNLCKMKLQRIYGNFILIF